MSDDCGDHHCPICKGMLWVCENHPDTPWEFCPCAAPGIPCLCNTAAVPPPGYDPSELIEISNEVANADDDRFCLPRAN